MPFAAASFLCCWVQVVCNTWADHCDLRNTECHNILLGVIVLTRECWSWIWRELTTLQMQYISMCTCQIDVKSWNLSEQGGILHIWARYNTCWGVLTLPQALVLKVYFWHFKGSSARKVKRLAHVSVGNPLSKADKATALQIINCNREQAYSWAFLLQKLQLTILCDFVLMPWCHSPSSNGDIEYW